MEFPTVDPGMIFTLVAGSLDRTRLARVQDYRLVLAERESRAELRRVVGRAGLDGVVDVGAGLLKQRVDG